jgi:hypothetical protein
VAGLRLAAVAAAVMLVGIGNAGADPINLGAAGSQNLWAVLETCNFAVTGNCQVSMSNGGAGGTEGFIQPIVAGQDLHVGINSVGSAGSFQSSGSPVKGEMLLHSGVASPNLSGGATISGGVIQGSTVDDGLSSNGTTDQLLAQAASDAISASNAANSKMATITSVTSVSSTTTITGGAGLNVVDLSSVNLNGGSTLTLSAPKGGTFIVNVANGFSLTGGSSVLLSGGLAPSDVLFNVLGTGSAVTINGGSTSNVPNAQMSGILLAPNGSISLAPALYTGEIIGGGQIQLASGAEVQLPARIPEPAGLPLFAAVAAVIVLPRLRIRALRFAAQRR